MDYSTEEPDQLDHVDRLDAELGLLDAMYPDCVTYTRENQGQGQGQGQSRQVHYISRPSGRSLPTGPDSGTDPGGGGGGSFTLRLPSLYPSQGLPELLSAQGGSGTRAEVGNDDIRLAAQRAIEELDLQEGVEVLDQIVDVFERVLAEAATAAAVMELSVPVGVPVGVGGGDEGAVSEDDGPSAQLSTKYTGLSAETRGEVSTLGPGPGPESGHSSQQYKTVVVWLHHLLATSKRKLALHPAVTTSIPSSGTIDSSPPPSSSISGITKPGYPGILVFAGPSALVDAHVRSLKTLNWQAFQVRYDSSLDSTRPSDTRVEDGKDESRFRKANTNANVKTDTRQKVIRRDLDHGHRHQHRHRHGEEWEFSHPKGKIIEVESMAELVRGLVSEEDREVFLRAVGVK